MHAFWLRLEEETSDNKQKTIKKAIRIDFIQLLNNTIGLSTKIIEAF